MNRDPRKASRLEDVIGPHEPSYKSRGEAQVGRLLDRYGIPFVYEQPIVVIDRGRYRRWHPDVSLPNHNGVVVEYAGMPDVPDYMTGIRHKQHVYAANTVPAMFVYPQDLQGPNWPQKLRDRICHFADQAICRRDQNLYENTTSSGGTGGALGYGGVDTDTFHGRSRRTRT